MSQTMDRQRIRNLRDGLRSESPGFSWAGAHLRVEFVEGIGTARIFSNGDIEIDPELDTDQQQLAFLHEICHAVWETFRRQGSRDHLLWNIAEDFAINNLLYEYHQELYIRAGALSDGMLRNPDWSGKSGEEIYDIIKMLSNVTKPPTGT